MAKEDYISKEIEDIILSSFKLKNEEIILSNKNIQISKIDIAKLLIKIIKFTKGKVWLFTLSYDGFKKYIFEMKNKSLLSQGEVDLFKKVISLLEKTEKYKSLINFSFLLQNVIDQMEIDLENMYQRITILEQEKINKEILKNF